MVQIHPHASEPTQSLQRMNWGVETQTGTVHPQPAPYGFPLARGVLPLYPLLQFISSGASELGTATPAHLLVIAGRQPLGLLLCDQWVKSCNCLQHREI